MNKELLEKYEALLNTKAKLEKECYFLYEKYLLNFGDMLLELFELKLKCVTTKKKITYCIKMENSGQSIYLSKLNNYVDDEISNYEESLLNISLSYKQALEDEKGEVLKVDEVAMIKKLYHMIAHLIHPDLHPEFKDNKQIEDLWNKAVDAYKCNQYKELTIIYDQIILLIKDSQEIEISDIEDKIAKIKDDIEKIKTNPPYTYKFILESEEMIKDEKENINEEINTYKEYLKSLEAALGDFTIINDIGA